MIMKTIIEKDIIELTMSWLIFAVTLFLGSVLLIPFLEGKILIQEQSEVFMISLLLLIDSIVFFPLFRCSKWLKYGLIGLNFFLFA